MMLPYKDWQLSTKKFGRARTVSEALAEIKKNGFWHARR